MKDSLIALARITGADPRPLSYRVTTGGNGLEDLSLPCEIWLHRPAYRGTDLKRILASVYPHPDPAGEFQVATLEAWQPGQKSRGRVRLRCDVEELDGWWICVEQERLIAGSDELYWFQVLGLPVRDEAGEAVATTAGYLETGAHGVLRLETPDGQEVLIPFVEQFVSVDLEGGCLRIPDFADFLP